MNIKNNQAEHDVIFRIRSIEEWLSITNLDSNIFSTEHTVNMLKDIKVKGIQNPLTGNWSPPEEVVISHENYRETISADRLISRHRAVLAELDALSKHIPKLRLKQCKIYAPEAVTDFALFLRSEYPYFLGSEYVESENEIKKIFPIPHQDLTSLTFSDKLFDLVISNDVFEHLYPLDKALGEISRVLGDNGILLANFPFAYGNQSGITKARKNQDGKIEYLATPEYHGNPMKPVDGSLVYEIPGWNIIERAKEAGFHDAYFSYISSANFGILGKGINGILVFVASNCELSQVAKKSNLTSIKINPSYIGQKLQSNNEYKEIFQNKSKNQIVNLNNSQPHNYFNFASKILENNSTVTDEKKKQLTKFLDVRNNKYILIANNPNISSQIETILKDNNDSWIIQFNKAAHNSTIKSNQIVFFYNGDNNGGLWGFESYVSIVPDYKNGLHFCFEVDTTPFNQANPNLSLISIPDRDHFSTIFNYPSDKTPSIGFLALLLLINECILNQVSPNSKIQLIGFSGASVLSQHHASVWEQEFIRILNFDSLSHKRQATKDFVNEEFSVRRGLLLDFYHQMHEDGYLRTDGMRVSSEQAFASFEFLRFIEYVDKSAFINASILDYGSGKSKWSKTKYNGATIKEALNYREVYEYEPSQSSPINIEYQNRQYDVVLMMDVLEHVYIGDIINTIKNALSLCKGHFICNIATYKAMALLPNGENAHITTRPTDWWLGIFEAISHEFPLIEITLFLSNNYNLADKYVIKGRETQDKESFESFLPLRRRQISLN